MQCSKDIAPVFRYNGIMTVKEFSKHLYDLYGTVTRARGCFLYTKKCVRITDLYQENGRAILGWHGGNAFTHLKNTLSRGLVGSFICEDKSRLNKAINILFESEREIFFFSDKKSALTCALDFSPENTTVYKPWILTSDVISKTEAIILEPPLPWTETVYIVAVAKKSCDINSTDTDKNSLYKDKITLWQEKSIIIPFVVQVAITRAIYNLIAELKNRQEKEWFIYDTVLTKYWERRGPYLIPKIPQEKYDDFVLHCLKLGIAINPDYSGKSIVPYGADKGVFTVLKNSPFAY